MNSYYKKDEDMKKRGFAPRAKRINKKRTVRAERRLGRRLSRTSDESTVKFGALKF